MLKGYFHKIFVSLKVFKTDSEQRSNVKCWSLAWSETADIGKL